MEIARAAIEAANAASALVAQAFAASRPYDMPLPRSAQPPPTQTPPAQPPPSQPLPTQAQEPTLIRQRDSSPKQSLDRDLSSYHDYLS